jgi:flagellar protein FlgJ
MPVSLTPAAAALPLLPQDSPKAGGTPEQKLKRTCQDFEALFIYKLLERMRATVPKEGYLHSAQEDVYQSICDQQVATALSRGKGMGLGEVLYRQLSGQGRPLPRPAAATTTKEPGGQDGGSEAR